MPKTNAAYRARRVAAGLCDWCGKPREHFKWLCDACRIKHRDRQRARWAAMPELCRITYREKARARAAALKRRRVLREKIMAYIGEKWTGKVAETCP